MTLNEIIPEAFTAFANRQPYSARNILIYFLADGQCILAYKGKPIAAFYPNGVLQIGLQAGDTTQGTMDILSYILRSGMCAPNASLLYAGSEVYLNGRLWDGSWKVVGLGDISAQYAIVHNLKQAFPLPVSSL